MCPKSAKPHAQPGSARSLTLTLPNAAKLLDISETLARQLARQGHFPGAFQMGRRWLVHRQVFEEQLEARARGEAFDPQTPDKLLGRALSEVRFRTNAGDVLPSR